MISKDKGSLIYLDLIHLKEEVSVNSDKLIALDSVHLVDTI